MRHLSRYTRGIISAGRAGSCRYFGVGVLAALALLGAPSELQGQSQGPVGSEVAPAPTPSLTADAQLRVFVDCQTWNCRRLQRFRERITFVEWVQLPQDADVLVLWTGQMAGAGYQYVFDFIGQGSRWDGVDEHLTFTSSATDVEEETLQALTRTLSAGLVRYVALAGLAPSLDVTWLGEQGDAALGARAQARAAASSGDDPWNYWVFNFRFNGGAEREDQVRETAFNFGGSANRTTEAWKIDLGFFGRTDSREFQLDDSTRVRNQIDDWGVDLVTVKSLDAHWSVGGQVEVQTSTRLNQDLRYRLAPAVEWNYFPWQDATRRRFVVLYANGLQHVDYETPTVFGKAVETLWVQELDVEYRAQEPWGSARAGIEASHLLNLGDKYSVEFDGRLDYRLFRGLSLEVSAQYSIIRDQIYLSGQGLDPDEIFLQRRQLATGSRLSLGFGVNYRFGSIFNSIVNARFPSVN